MPGAPSGRGRARLARAALTLAGSAVLALAASEAVLRLAGVTPETAPRTVRGEPLVHEPDARLGWRTRPGSYVLPPYVPGGESAVLTIWPDGSRATAEQPVDGPRRVLLLGCSFTFGWAVGDASTFAWQLQERRPELKIVNRGVNAYGTYQALLLLEEALARGERFERVIYGFHEVHEERNVAAPRWLAVLDRLAHRGSVEVPYATLDGEGALVRHPPERYPAWPLRDRLATVAFLAELAARRAGEERVAQRRRVTEQLILAMRDLCARHGIAFDVVLLQARPGARRHYARFLERQRIPFADCVVPITPDRRVPGEGHPNGEVHAEWARCIDEAILAPNEPDARQAARPRRAATAGQR